MLYLARCEYAGKAAIPVPGYDGRPMEVNRAFMQKGAYKQLSYYWFPQPMPGDEPALQCFS